VTKIIRAGDKCDKYPDLLGNELLDINSGNVEATAARVLEESLQISGEIFGVSS